MGITVMRDTQLTQATRATRLTPVHRPMDCHMTRATRRTPVHRTIDCQATRDALLTPVRRDMDTKAARYTLLTPVPVTDLPAMVIPAVLRRNGLLGLSTGSSLLAEFQSGIHLDS
jgi:hypothetical protein